MHYCSCNWFLLCWLITDESLHHPKGQQRFYMHFCVMVVVMLCNLAAFIYFPQGSVIFLGWLKACRSQMKEDESKAANKSRPARMCFFSDPGPFQRSHSCATGWNNLKNKMTGLYTDPPKNAQVTHNIELFHCSSKSYYPCNAVATVNARYVLISFVPLQFGR